MSESKSHTDKLAQLYEKALVNLSTNKPIIFTNLLRFHKQAQYPRQSQSQSQSQPTSTSASEPGSKPNTSPCAGQTAYFTRYFPLYDKACVDILGENEAKRQQRVLYKGKNLSLLKGSVSLSSSSESKEDNNNDNDNDNDHKNGNDKWDAVVMTWVAGWDVVRRISESDTYTKFALLHRDAAVVEDVLWVSEAVDGFDM